MKQLPDYSACLSVLERENSLVARIASFQALVKRSVRERKWTDFRALMQGLKQVGEELKTVEAERMALIPDDNQHFYQMAVGYPEEERSRLTEIYRQLKMSVLKIRLENESLSNYIKQSESVAADFIETAGGNGRSYSSEGKRKQPDMSSMVVEAVA
jgi:pyridoxine 5'-phosphate synthase PdxJ